MYIYVCIVYDIHTYMYVDSREMHRFANIDLAQLVSLPDHEVMGSTPTFHGCINKVRGYVWRNRDVKQFGRELVI